MIVLNNWQKCVWAGALLLILVSLFSLTGTAETSSSGRVSRASGGQTEYFSFQDSGKSETYYGVREGDRSVIYNSMPAGR